MKERINLTKKWEKNYNRISIPKKSGGYRIIHSYTNLSLKKKHKKVISRIGGNKEFLAFDGIGIERTTEIHVDNNSFITIDFSNFFPSVHGQDVYDALKDKGLYYRNDLLAGYINEVTDENGFLLQGTCLSPYFANATLKELDEQMNKMGKSGEAFQNNRFLYSRYADDMVISFSDAKSEDELKNLANEIINFIQNFCDENYKNSKIAINPKKTQVRTFAKDNHIPLLTWKIIRGKDGQPNYITAGRKKHRVRYNVHRDENNLRNSRFTSYWSYQEHVFKNSDKIKKNKRKSNKQNVYQINLKRSLDGKKNV